LLMRLLEYARATSARDPLARYDRFVQTIQALLQICLQALPCQVLSDFAFDED